MPKAIIAYSFDDTDPALIKLANVGPIITGVTTMAWTLYLNGVSKATSNAAQWNLDFKDVNPILSTGYYTITLVVTDTVGGIPTTDTVSLGVSYDSTDLGSVASYYPIYVQVTTILGTSIDVPSNEFQQLRDKWQFMLYQAFGVAFNDIHNERVWPSLANTLIAYLIVRDTILNGANRELAQMNESSGGSGAVKRVETGPVNTEWFDSGSVYKNIFSTTSGFWEELMTSICGLASQAGVYIKNCKEEMGGHPPILLPKSGDYSYMEQYIIAPQFTLRS